eukprot:1617213-Amphidinium_carterae.1
MPESTAVTASSCAITSGTTSAAPLASRAPDSSEEKKHPTESYTEDFFPQNGTSRKIKNA